MCLMAIKHANIPEAAAKSTVHDDDDRLEAVARGLLSFAWGLCLTPGKVLSEKGPVVMY